MTLGRQRGLSGCSTWKRANWSRIRALPPSCHSTAAAKPSPRTMGFPNSGMACGLLGRLQRYTMKSWDDRLLEFLASPYNVIGAGVAALVLVLAFLYYDQVFFYARFI